MEPTQAPQSQPEQTSVAAPTPEATPVQPASPITQPAVPQGGKGLAITALVLGIVSAVLALLWFVAAPLAITAIILAIVSLVQHRPGKGMSIAGLIVAGVALVVFVPFWLLLSLAAYSNLGEAAQNKAVDQSQIQVQ